MSDSLWSLALALALAAFASSQQGSSAGYYLSEAALDVDLPTMLSVAAPHAVEISRSGRMNILRLAEAVLPPQAVVSAAGRAARFGDSGPLPDRDLWWLGLVEGVRVPYAVNALAVAHYLEVSEQRRFGETPRQTVEVASSSLRYHGRVSEHRQYFRGTRVFTDVYIAHLEFEYSHGHEGIVSGTGIMLALDRVVVLDREGQVLAVFGDTVPDVWSFGAMPHNKSQQLTDRSCHGPCVGKSHANPAAPDAPAAEPQYR